MTSPTASVHRVFISHAEEDADFAHRLADDLKRLGVEVWIAPESVPPGDPWVTAIEHGLSKSSHLVVVMTPAAVKSPWVNMETDSAITLERKGQMEVIPLDVEVCDVPLFWRQYQMIPFRQGYDAGLNWLVARLGLSLVATPTEPSSEPEYQKAIQDIVTALRLIMEAGGDYNYVTFIADESRNYFVQLGASRGGEQLHGEAVSNEYLEPQFELTEQQVRQLLNIGWTPPKQNTAGNFFRAWVANDDNDRLLIAREVMRTLVEVYGWSPDQQVASNLHLGD